MNLTHTETVTIEGPEEISFLRSFYCNLLDLLLNELQKTFFSDDEVMVQLSALNPLKWNEKNSAKLP